MAKFLSLVIRLKRVRFNRNTIYRLVLMRSVKHPSSGYIEKLGFYGLTTNPRCFFINVSRLAYWILNGATISARIKILLVKLFAK